MENLRDEKILEKENKDQYLEIKIKTIQKE